MESKRVARLSETFLSVPWEALGDEDVAVQLAAQGAMSKVADIGDPRTVPSQEASMPKEKLETHKYS